jgi:hypothetical protein
MSTLVLHIGSPKAGSSAIQASLLQARWRHGWRGLPPNPYGKPYPSGFIAGLYLQPGSLPRFLAQRQHDHPARFEGDLQRYRRQLARSLQPRWRRNPKGLVMSCEYLWRLPPVAVARLRQDFEALGCQRFLVLAYVREPGSLYGSALQQWSRLSTDMKRFDPNRWRYELRRRLETWASVFGESLLVRPFERSQLQAGCMVRDLQQQVEHALPDLPSWPLLAVVPDVNRSATCEELVAMQALMVEAPEGSRQSSARAARAWITRWDELSAHLPDGSGSSIRVRPEVLERVRARHREDLLWLAEHHGVSFNSVLERSGPRVEPLSQSAQAPTAVLRLADLIEPPEDQALLQRLTKLLAEQGAMVGGNRDADCLR